MSNFEPVSGKYLAYPCGKEIVLLDTTSWERLFVFSHTKVYFQPPPFEIIPDLALIHIHLEKTSVNKIFIDLLF